MCIYYFFVLRFQDKLDNLWLLAIMVTVMQGEIIRYELCLQGQFTKYIFPSTSIARILSYLLFSSSEFLYATFVRSKSVILTLSQCITLDLTLQIKINFRFLLQTQWEAIHTSKENYFVNLPFKYSSNRNRYIKASKSCLVKLKHNLIKYTEGYSYENHIFP